MLEAPQVKLPEGAVTAFRAALEARNAESLPPDVPRWMFLMWLAREGYLLHGSPHANLPELVPQHKAYAQPDSFSNTHGVYAASDGLWALMYALTPPGTNRSDMALKLRQPDGSWSGTRYFFSVGGPPGADGQALLRPGVVYVLSREGFALSPAYNHPGLGSVQEWHWVSRAAVRPLMTVAVTPGDFPLPVRVHDAAEVRRRAQADPWGFPWLEPGETVPGEPAPRENGP